MTILYSVSEEVVSLSIILSFVIFLFVNFPANSLIDRRGIRVSLCLGTGLYFGGFGLYLLINKSYYLVLIGTFLMGIGQPFIINLPAKIASLWFSSENVTPF
jgi:FLVCR family feline leukemia virus subgroup C receptor-related protein